MIKKKRRFRRNAHRTLYRLLPTLIGICVALAAVTVLLLIALLSNQWRGS